MKKTILTIITIITLLATIGTLPTYAALPDPGETVEPMWDNTDIINIAISFPEEGYGFSECLVVGKSDVTKIVIEIVVYKKVGLSWLQVAEKQETINRHGGLSSCQFTPVEGATYKSTYKITVTKNNINEVIEKENIAVCEFD
jgi:hypothetical protein